MGLSPEECRRLVATARVARLATVGPHGRVDLVPIVFAFDGGRLVSAVDHKPKRTTQLGRLANIRARPEVTVLVDHYDDADWSALWWVRLRGTATVVEHGESHERAVAALVARYQQYRDRPPQGPAIVVDITEWLGWRGG